MRLLVTSVGGTSVMLNTVKASSLGIVNYNAPPLKIVGPAAVRPKIRRRKYQPTYTQTSNSNSNSNLNHAVQMWVNKNTTACNTYDSISSWNTSTVTDINNMFLIPLRSTETLVV